MSDSVISVTVSTLTQEQQTAMRVLFGGKSVAAAAEAERVHRGTVHLWLQIDPAFQAAFNAWQHELRTSTRARLLALCDRAVDTLCVALDKSDAKTALTLLRGMNMIAPPDLGPTDPAEVHARQVLDQRNRAVGIAKAESDTIVSESCNGVRYEPNLLDAPAPRRLPRPTNNTPRSGEETLMLPDGFEV